ncbi:hypothetical protein QBA54_07475 [Streptomyces sp. B21-108]|uniref:hypothetical protein n=1 Tax=Streptomyces sp. B21-108 TaxID=3039419 RepID=UPI002FF2E031
MSTHILISGGPHDGQSLVWESKDPPDIISLPVPPEAQAGLTTTAHYGRGRNWDGRSIHADDGAFIYEFNSETA